MSTLKVHCSRKYHREPEAQVITLGNNVLTKYFTSALFPTKVVTLLNFTNAVGDYTTTWNDYHHGGVNQKGAFEAAKLVLMADLDKIADDVDSIANGLEATVIAGGFSATKSSTAPAHAPLKPTHITAGNQMGSGIIDVEIAKVPDLDEEEYRCICVEGTALVDPAKMFADGVMTIDPAVVTQKLRFDFSTSRKKIFKGLTNGTPYFFYFVIVNSAGMSPISDYVEKAPTK